MDRHLKPTAAAVRKEGVQRALAGAALAKSPGAKADEVAMAGYYASYYPALLAFARACFAHAPDQAEDLVHEAFLLFWRRLQAGEAPTNDPEAFLFTLVRDRALKTRRSEERSSNRILSFVRQRDIERDEHWLDPGREGDEPESRLRRIWRAAQSLPPRTRAVFTLVHSAGHSYAESARLLGMSVATLRWHLHSALVAIREVVTNEGKGAPGAAGAAQVERAADTNGPDGGSSHVAR
jgi:RNA polymerase sigma-70 factor (ECF subfamily)